MVYDVASQNSSIFGVELFEIGKKKEEVWCIFSFINPLSRNTWYFSLPH